MSRASIYLCCLVTLFFTSAAPAIYLPECPVGCTLQTWTFDTLTNPTAPEFYDNIYDTPMAELSTTQPPPNYFGWMNVVDGRQGVWVGDPLQIELTIPNQRISNPYKLIHLEMEFQSILDYINVTPSPVGGSTVEEISRDISPVDSQWKKLTIDWRIEPNPNEEIICISITGTGGFLDYITVETCCIPEPATITLLGLGAMTLLTGRRQ